MHVMVPRVWMIQECWQPALRVSRLLNAEWGIVKRRMST